MSSTTGRRRHQKSAAIVEDLPHSPPTSLSDLYTQLSTLYNPLQWTEISNSKRYGTRWYIAYQQGNAALHDQKYRHAIRFYSEVSSLTRHLRVLGHSLFTFLFCIVCLSCLQDRICEQPRAVVRTS